MLMKHTGSPFEVNVEGRKDDKMSLVVDEEMITDFDCRGYRPGWS